MICQINGIYFPLLIIDFALYYRILKPWVAIAIFMKIILGLFLSSNEGSLWQLVFDHSSIGEDRIRFFVIVLVGVTLFGCILVYVC